jgi:hypothetical protein
MAEGNLLTTLLIAFALAACGGSTPAADSPADAAADPSTAAADGSAGDAAAPAPKDGIMRDADGDGVPDNTGGGCTGKNETQCKINSSCAWTDEGTCVEAKASPM